MQEKCETRIAVIGDIGQVRSVLPSAVQDAGWTLDAFPTLDAFLTAPRTPRTLVIVVIDTFTIASLELIRNLAAPLGLPVIAFGLEHHPMMIRAALEAGAEDVISMPSPVEEIVARLKAITRVRFPPHNRQSEQPTYRLDDIARSVSIDGGPAIRLALAEYRMLKTLLAAPNQPVSRVQLNAHLLPFTRSRTPGTLDVTIGRLRRKLGEGRVQTIRGVGYRLVDEHLHASHDAQAPANVCG